MSESDSRRRPTPEVILGHSYVLMSLITIILVIVLYLYRIYCTEQFMLKLVDDFSFV